jgi:hypothetical protein
MKKTELPSFHIAFQISAKKIFEVSYYKRHNNSNKYFATSAAEFNRNKTDYIQCGQAQKELLFGDTMNFYKKFDILHLQDLNKKQYSEIVADLEVLKAKYNYVLHESDLGISFSHLVDLSRTKMKKQ